MGNYELDLDADDWYEMPGGNDFEDATKLFANAGEGMFRSVHLLNASRSDFLIKFVDMELGEVIFMDGFGLLDAMSAFEVGKALSLGLDGRSHCNLGTDR